MVIRNRPEDHGEASTALPPKRRMTPEDDRLKQPKPTRDFTAREALRTPAFWLLSLGHGFALLVVHAVSVHADHPHEGRPRLLARAGVAGRSRW